MTSITIPVVGVSVDVQLLTSLVAMGMGVFLGWLMARSHYIQAGWQYCSCPKPDCEHCVKDYRAEADAVVDEALSGCDVHEESA